MGDTGPLARAHRRSYPHASHPPQHAHQPQGFRARRAAPHLFPSSELRLSPPTSRLAPPPDRAFCTQNPYLLYAERMVIHAVM